MQTELTIMAHRGGADRAPENSIAAFRQALEDGADAFECDVSLTKDKEPVIIHTKFNQYDIRQATGSTCPLNTLNWAEVKSIKIRNSGEPVCRLDDVLSFVNETKLRCFIEPKLMSDELIRIVINRIQYFNLAKIVGILTFYSRRKMLIQAKHIEPNIQTSVIILNPFADFLASAKSANANHVILGWKKFNQFRFSPPFGSPLKQKIIHLKKNGIVPETGFICTRGDVEWALRNEIEGLWTDNVPKIKKIIEAIAE